MPITTYTVTGKLVSGSGAGMQGVVSFTLSADAYLSDDSATVVAAEPIYATVNSDGTYSVQLYANVDLDPPGSTWKVVESYQGAEDIAYTIVVPHGGGQVPALIVP